MSAERLSARVHRHRFSTIQKVHPCSLDTTLVEILGLRGLPLAVASFAGIRAASALHAVARSVSSFMSNEAHAVQAALTRKLYLCGGRAEREELNTVEVFDIVTGTWDSLPPMLHRRSAAVAAVIEGCLYVCGGNGPSMERFTPSTFSWEALPPMAHERQRAAAAVLAGQFIVCGGFGGDYLNSVERFDPKTYSWSPMPSLTEERAGGCAAVVGGRVHVCGGGNWSHEPFSVERLIAELGTWELLPLPTLYYDKHCYDSAALAVIGDTLYVCGGLHSQGRDTALDSLNLLSGVWTVLPPMSVGRSCATATVVNKRLYVCGGSSSKVRFPDDALDCMECFDPATGTWSMMPSMPRCRHTAAGTTLVL